MRSGKIKFTYNTDYTAAKRKTKEEGEKSRTEFTLAKADQLQILPEENITGPEEDPTFPNEGFAFSLDISYVDSLTFVPAEPYAVEEGSYFSETLEIPREPFKPILTYMDKLLRLALWIYLLLFPIRTSAQPWDDDDGRDLGRDPFGGCLDCLYVCFCAATTSVLIVFSGCWRRPTNISSSWKLSTTRW